MIPAIPIDTEKLKKPIFDYRGVKRSNESLLGFFPEWVDNAGAGSNDSVFPRFIYKKLKEKLHVETGSYSRNIDVYFSGTDSDEVNELLHYLVPNRNKIIKG